LAVGYPRQNHKNEDFSSYQDVLAVANEISEELGLEVFDLFPSENRRKVTKLESIRIAHYQIIRGLSASHVILFDFDTLQNWCEADPALGHPPLRNMGNIALSRSKVSTVVALRPEVKSTAVAFIEDLLNFIRSTFFK
jgi:hypothetical protein